MKSLLITLVGFLFITILNTQTNEKFITVREYNPSKSIAKIENIKLKNYKTLDLKKVYCSDYINQYDWNDTVAYNVMMIESSNKPRNLNNNPYTGDYSVGCFQINLLGSNLGAKYSIMARLGYTGALEREEMKKWLWSAENNVMVAYELYKDSQWGPWSFTTCKKVACY